MRAFLIGTVSLLLGSPIVLAQTNTAGRPCHEVLWELVEQWNAIGYPEPAKPGQMRVIGHSGHENSGPEVSYMRTQIRLALRDCENGKEESVRRLVKVVYELLNSTPNG